MWTRGDEPIAAPGRSAARVLVVAALQRAAPLWQVLLSGPALRVDAVRRGAAGGGPGLGAVRRSP